MKINNTTRMLSNKTYYVKYKHIGEVGVLHERGSANAFKSPLSKWSIEDLNEDIKNGYIEIIEYKKMEEK